MKLLLPTVRCRLLAGLALLCLAIALQAQEIQPDALPLTQADQVLALTDKVAGKRLPVEVTGVVTACEADWRGQFFVQDETGGVFVENIAQHRPKAGDLVHISGVTHPGAFAPIISEPRWKKVGEAPMPKARRVVADDLVAGVYDGERLEVEGQVRSTRASQGMLHLILSIGGYRVQVRLPQGTTDDATGLIGATVRVRGTAATSYNAALRHLTDICVYAPMINRDDFVVIEREQNNPFEQPAILINRVAQYRRGMHASNRIHIRGQVSLIRPGRFVCIQDGSGGIRVETSEQGQLTAGQWVDAVGFLDYQGHLPFLSDGVLKPAAGETPPATALEAQEYPLTELRDGRHYFTLMRMRGRVLDRSTMPTASHPGLPRMEQTTLYIQGEDLGFTVEHEAPREAGILTSVPLGSTVDVEGICWPTVDMDGKLLSMRLLMPTPDSLDVVSQPSWFTPQRLLIIVALLMALLAIAVAWSLSITKKNRMLHFLVRERERAQQELQDAHDSLEQKVIERTAQLKVEMTARKTAEVQFKAVIQERTRLARDLHDTLEQALTGIALQLDTTACFLGSSIEKAAHHLKLTRRWLSQSQNQLRQSIWDLRSRELEQFDLSEALRLSAERVAESCGVTVEFDCNGERRPLPEVIEENVLRIGQEAMTNIAKHARARAMRVRLHFSPAELGLEVDDDGTGFDYDPSVPHKEHHFGLQGMSERAIRMGGRLEIDSASGHGTHIRVCVPLKERSAQQAATASIPG